MSVDSTLVYFRMVRESCLYSSERLPNKRSNNSFVQLKDESFIKITCYLVDTENDNEFILCKKIKTLNCFGNAYKQMKRINYIEEEITAVATEEIKTICVFIKIQQNMYICPMPNLLHY